MPTQNGEHLNQKPGQDEVAFSQTCQKNAKADSEDDEEELERWWPQPEREAGQ